MGPGGTACVRLRPALRMIKFIAPWSCCPLNPRIVVMLSMARSMLPPSMLDTAFGFEELRAVGAMVGHGGILAFDERTSIAELVHHIFSFGAYESCGKCTPCRIGAVRGVEVIDRIRRGENATANLVLLRELCDTMITGSLCGLGGMAPFPVMSVLNHFPEDLQAPAETARRSAG